MRCGQDEKWVEVFEEEQDQMELVKMMRTLIRKKEQALTLLRNHQHTVLVVIVNTEIITT